MIKGSGKLNKETYESLLKQGISAEDIAWAYLDIPSWWIRKEKEE